MLSTSPDASTDADESDGPPTPEMPALALPRASISHLALDGAPGPGPGPAERRITSAPEELSAPKRGPGRRYGRIGRLVQGMRKIRVLA